MVISLEESTTECISPVVEGMVRRVTYGNKAPDSIQKDYLLILLIASMIENGFVAVDESYEILHLECINAERLNNWRSPTGVFEVLFIMTAFKNTPVKLIVSPLGAMALVNVIIKDFEAETYTVCFPMSKYVVAPLAATIPKIFRDLKHFSICYKNKVLSAVKSRILHHYGYASASLVGLPEELIFKIMLNLPVHDVINVSSTCLRLRGVLESERFWHDIMKRDYSLVGNGHALTEYYWKLSYMDTYRLERDKEQARNKMAGSMHDYMDYSDYHAYIDNPMWNVLL